MSAPDLNSLRDYLRLVASDHALLDSFRHGQPELVDLFKAVVGEPQKPTAPLCVCPDLSTVDAWQVTVFDNWRGGDKRGKRYGANLRAWSLPVNWTAPIWEASVKFWEAGREAEREAKKLTSAKLRCPLTEGTLELLAGLAEGGYTHVGVAKRQAFGEGTFYFNEHVVGLELHGAKPARVDFFVVPGGAKSATSFSSLDGQQKQLTGNAFAQARVTEHASLLHWATA